MRVYVHLLGTPQGRGHPRFGGNLWQRVFHDSISFFYFVCYDCECVWDGLNRPGVFGLVHRAMDEMFQ